MHTPLLFSGSQLRYVHYFDQLLQRGPRSTGTLRIVAIRLIGCPEFGLVRALCFVQLAALSIQQGYHFPLA